MPDTDTQTAATDPQQSARAHAAELLPQGARLHGFTVTHVSPIPELEADAYVLHHDASGARLLYLACEDENKAFAIGFKTPPADDTGVFHILEHSVLCGSAKFPVKEPFVDLIKSSMQTFLNAMTYPDKTVYPVASTNEQDLLNLMDVYMDAVLNPAIYTKRAIFEQEGWHYELDVPEDAPLADGRLRYNGVVFNEMKGALSDPMDVLDNAIMRELFPDTAYAFESGGHPRAIPRLTYEGFLDTHARHYNLSNSYIVLYGDMSVERELAFLDDSYLGDAAREAARAAKAAARGGAGTGDAGTVGVPNPLELQRPVVCEHAVTRMATTPENALVGLAYVIGEASDRKRLIAADILFDALLATNEAPVKKAVIEAGLGGNLASYTAGDLLQPYELIILQNADEDVAAKFRRVVEDTCRRLVEEGIPRDRLEAVIASEEYDLRQRDYGYPDGVALACDALGTWLYDDSDEAATRGIRYADAYRELRGELAGTYFEDLLRELVLDSDHNALVELMPVDGGGADGSAGDEDAGEAAELAATMASMSEADLQRVVDDVAELRRQQEAEDAPNAKATLPRLRVSDIGPARPEQPLVVDATAPVPCLRHDIPTHRLAYALTYFDLSHLAFSELPYVTVLARLMQQLTTERRSAAELDSHIAKNLGFLSFTTEVFTQPNWKLARPYLLVSAGALSEKIGELASIPREVWAETVFEDTDRMRDVLTQLRIGMEQGFLMNGHSAALARSMSYVSPASVLVQQLSGVDFYRFLRDTLEHFDERAEGLCDTLRELSARIFTSTGTIASFTGSEEDYARYWEAAGDLGLSPRTARAKELYVPMPEDRHEAFVDPQRRVLPGRGDRPAHTGHRGRRHLGRGGQRAVLRLPVERGPREGRGVRLRVPLGGHAPGELLHVPRPGHRPLARAHRRGGRLALVLRARPRGVRGLHRELRLQHGRAGQALRAHQAPVRRVPRQGRRRRPRAAPRRDARRHPRGAPRPGRAGRAHRRGGSRLRVRRARGHRGERCRLERHRADELGARNGRARRDGLARSPRGRCVEATGVP